MNKFKNNKIQQKPDTLLRVDNPRRPVDWRWIKARQMHTNGRKRGGRFTDVLVSKLIVYLNDKYKGKDSEELASKHPYFYEVDSIYSDCDVERWMLEGLIISGEDQEDIASDFGLTKEIVQLYEALIFDVRNRLSQKMFIMGQVLNTATSGEFDDSDKDKWWKVLGYHGWKNELGSAIIRAEWDYAELPTTVKDWYHSVVDSALAKRGAVTASSRRMNKDVAEYLMANYWQSRRTLEAKEAEGSGDSPGEELLESLSMTIQDVTQANDHTHAHKRDHQLLEEELNKLNVEDTKTEEASTNDNS